jgi:glycosyltransferase involved in cell wall biosynthesis
VSSDWPVNVLVVDCSVGVGGAEVTLLSLLRRLDHTRFVPIAAVAGEGRFRQRLTEIGVESYIVPMDPLLRTRNLFKLVRYPLAVRTAVRALGRLIRERDISLIHTNSMRAHLYGLLAARRVGVPAVPHLQDLHRPPMARRIICFLFGHWADRIVVNSRAVRALFDDDRRCRDKVELIYQALEIEHFDPATSPREVQAKFGLDGCYPVVGLIANIHPMKRPDDLIRAAPAVLAEFPTARFLLIGDTLPAPRDYLEFLQQLVEELGLSERVIFTGFCQEISPFYAAMDMLVLPSSGEPFGKVMIEAMAMQKPVIGTADGGPLEVIEDGVTGRLVPPLDPQALAGAIVEIARDPERARAFGMAGRERVKQAYTFERYVAAFETLFEDVLIEYGKQKE